MLTRTAILSFLLLILGFVPAWPQGQVVELSCPSCGYVQRFVQGTTPEQQSRNVQSVILVCERSNEIRNERVPLDPSLPVAGEPLGAKQHGTGVSKLLGIDLPKFLVPGNTCALFPVTAYLEANVCPIDGSPGFYSAIVGHF